MSLFQVVLVSRIHRLTGELVHQLPGETVVVTPRPLVISRLPLVPWHSGCIFYPCLVGGYLVVIFHRNFPPPKAVHARGNAVAESSWMTRRKIMVGGCLVVAWWLLGGCLVVAWWLLGCRLVVAWWLLGGYLVVG